MLKIFVCCSSSSTLTFNQKTHFDWTVSTNTPSMQWSLIYGKKCWRSERHRCQLFSYKQKYTLISCYWHSWTTHTLPPQWGVFSSRDAEPQFDRSRWWAADSDHFKHTLQIQIHLVSVTFRTHHFYIRCSLQSQWSSEQSGLKIPTLHLGSYSVDHT